MADNAKQEFGKRRQVSALRSPVLPPKRSNHVALLVMGTLAVGGSAYALMPRECTQPVPGSPGLTTPAECPPRSSASGSGGGSSRYGYYSGGSSGGVRRGGFGAVAHSFSSHFSFGG